MTRTEINNYLRDKHPELVQDDVKKIIKCLPDNLETLTEYNFERFIKIIVEINHTEVQQGLVLFKGNSKQKPIYYDPTQYEVMDGYLHYIGDGSDVMLPAKCTCCDYMFKGFKGDLDLNGIDTSHVTSMRNMFEDVKLSSKSVLPNIVSNILTDTTDIFLNADINGVIDAELLALFYGGK